MVCLVFESDDVKRNRLSRQLHPSSRGMAIKPILSKWVFGHWRFLHYILVLVLLLQCHSVTSQAVATNATNAGAVNSATYSLNATEINGAAATLATTNETVTNAEATTNATVTNTETNATATNTTATTAATITASNPFTKIFTSIATTHNLSSPSITMTSSQLTPALTTISMPCSFSLSCNQTFYWMQISITKEPQNNQNVTAWLNNVDKCKQKGNDNSLVEAMEVTCYAATDDSMETLCDVLLKLSGPADVCCIRQTVRQAGSSSNATVVGDIEQVGVCLNSRTNFPPGPYNTCDQSVNSSNLCPSAAQNFMCGNNENIVTLVDYQQNCTTGQSTSSEYSCNCSSSCSGSHAYYSLNVSNVNTSVSAIQSSLNVSSCNNISACNNTATQTFTSIYLGSRSFQCSEGMPSCSFIVKLSTAMNTCDVQKALESITQQKVSVTRVAMCSWNNDNSLNGNITMVERSVSFVDFCRRPDNFSNTFKCSESSSVAFLLNDSCNSSQTVLNSTTAPPSTTASSNASLVDADGLLKMTANASALNSSQVDSIVFQLETLISGPNISVALANTSVNIVNNLLDVPVAVMAPFSKRASGIVDTVGLKLVVSGETQSILSSSLALAVKKVNGNNFQETTFSMTDPSSLELRAQLQVPLGSITLPSSLTQNLSLQEQQIASRVQFNFYQKSTFFQDKSLGKRTLISGILSASVANLSISELQKNVSITLRNTEPIPVNHSASCVFWDVGLNGGAGGWSTSGCRVLNSSAQETQCSCNHLTSFGVLLIMSQGSIDPLQYTILTYITYIGCGISAIFLSVTLLTYLAFGKLRKDIPSKILIQLCLALLLLNLVFLVDAWLAQYTDVTGLCISTAFFLHYFLLASFTWMAMEAVHMYLALVKVFNTYISRFMLKIGLAGWGIPLIVVVIVVATNNVGKNYGLVSYGKFVDGTTDHFCWIINDIVFYVAVVAYFGLIFLLNFTMFIVVLVQLCRIKRQNPQNMQNRSSLQELRSVAGLTVLLGLTWGFAFFAWGPVNLAFMYLFAIFNSLQGLFIFVFHCAMKENVRRQWRTYLCCGKFRLAENSEWSRTATQKINKATKKRPLSTQSNNSTSSFLHNDSIASDMPIGISNPFDDRIITASERPGSDVIMNELNATHRKY